MTDPFGGFWPWFAFIVGLLLIGGAGGAAVMAAVIS